MSLEVILCYDETKKRRLLKHVTLGGVTFEVSSRKFYLFTCVTQKPLPVYVPVLLLCHVTVLLVKLLYFLLHDTHCTLDYLFSHICATRYITTSLVIFNFCCTSRNIILVFDVRRLTHYSLFCSHKSHFCCLLFLTRHFFNI